MQEADNWQSHVAQAMATADLYFFNKSIVMHYSGVTLSLLKQLSKKEDYKLLYLALRLVIQGERISMGRKPTSHDLQDSDKYRLSEYKSGKLLEGEVFDKVVSELSDRNEAFKTSAGVQTDKTLFEDTKSTVQQWIMSLRKGMIN